MAESEQVTMFDLPRTAAAIDPQLSYTVRLTLRRKALLAQGIHPTTKRRLLPEAEGRHCKDCDHCAVDSGHSRSFTKCTAVVHTFGPSSDTQKRWPACEAFKERGESDV